MAMAIDLAAKEGADLVLATDPDSDRIGVALRNKKGEYVLLNGNQTLVLLLSYQLTRWAERGELDGNAPLVTFADKLDAACIATIQSGTMTGDLACLCGKTGVTSVAFLDAVRAALERSL